MSITHIEDLSPKILVGVLQDLCSCEFSEKYDGSQLLFGVDEKGFYTSRELHNGKRVYSIDEYAPSYANIYLTFIHSFLHTIYKSELNTLCQNKTYFQVEAEFISPSTINVIDYHDRCSLVLLRTLEGNLSLCDLVSMFTPIGKSEIFSSNSKLFQLDHPSFIIPTISVAKEYSLEIPPKLQESITIILQFLHTPELKTGKQNFELLSLPLNKCPEFIKKEAWKDLKITIDILKQEYLGYLRNIKHFLLEANIWNIYTEKDKTLIEGIVGKTKNGVVFKIVDRDAFIEMKNFLWKEREYIRKIPTNVNNIESIMGFFYIETAKVLGIPELGTTRARYLLDNELIIKLSSVFLVEKLRSECIEIILTTNEMLRGWYREYKNNLDKNFLYANWGPHQVKVDGSRVFIRTHECYITQIGFLEALRNNIQSASTSEEILRCIYDRYLERNI